MTGGAGTLVRAARARAGLTQRALGERAGVPQPTIAAIERGRQDPRHRTLERLLRACGCEIDLVRRSGAGVDGSGFRITLRLTATERLERVAQGARALRRLRAARRVD